MGTVHLLRLLSLFTGISVLQQVKTLSITVPRTVTAVEGGCVVVSCQTSEPHSRVIWYQYHGIHYPIVYDGLKPRTVLPQFRGRTSVPGKAAEGNCSLMIDNVQKADNNLQVYAWIGTESKAAHMFHHQTVTIIVERHAPVISVQQKVVDGKVFKATCAIQHSCPSSTPSLHWNRSPYLERPTVMSFNKKAQGSWLYIETLDGLATYKMHSSTINCSAKFKDFTLKSQQITLDVLYKPLNVTLKHRRGPVLEGHSVTMECAANCKPEPHTYSWLKSQMGNNTKINSTMGKMSFNNITRGTSLSCIAYNDFGEGQSDWLELNVHYAPVILPESSCSLMGEVLKCFCWAEAFPTASIHWTIGNETLQSSSSFVLKNKNDVVSDVMTVRAQSQSNISCKAFNYVDNITKQLSVNSKSETSSLPAWLTTLIILGTAVLCGCIIYIYRKYSVNRLFQDFLFDTILSRQQSSSCNVQLEETYSSPPKSKDKNPESSPWGPESDPEMERLRDVYDNDFVEEMLFTRDQQHENSATVHQNEDEIQPEECYGNVGDDLNF